ncbi:MAG: hypothetical protein D6806_04430 [Deltaproteobacteria bacterium]|nr:MAG: hypothetical protein D6806_04430 [Deltaproteobacteria bacterium]
MSTWRLLAWIGTGTAGAAAVTSTLLFIFGTSKRSDADAQWEIVKDTSLPKPRRDAAYAKATDLDTQADRLFLGAWITGGFTIAAAAATVYLFVAKPATEDGPVVTLLPSPEGIGVNLSLSF